jgi:nicotinamide riboside kinase
MGAHSTGKTSFVARLHEACTNRGLKVVSVSDLGAAAAEEGFGVLRDHCFESTLWIMTTGIASELSAALDHDVVIADRAVPDALGYLSAALKYRGEELPPHRWHSLKCLARHHARDYDLLIKTELDTTVPIADDGRRDLDWHFRSVVDDCLEDLIAELGLQATRLSMANVESWNLRLWKALHMQRSMLGQPMAPIEALT